MSRQGHARDHPHDLSAGAHGHSHGGGIRGVLASIFVPHSHDPSDSVDDALTSSRAGVRALKISLLVLMATALAQLVVVAFTGSVALLADTIHNFSDALTAVPLWIAFVLVRRAPTRRYTFGLGRLEDLAGLFIVAMIALSATIAGYESILRLIQPRELEAVWVVLVAGVIGFLGNEWVALFRIRVGRRIGSAALVADGLHARVDGFTSLAVAAGAIGVMLGYPLADPIVGLLITVAILVVLRGAAVEVFRRLMDGVDPGLVDAAEAAISGTPGVRDVGELHLRWIGHELVADASIRVDPSLGVTDAHAIAHAAEARVLAEVPRTRRVVVHAGPAE